MNKKSHIFILGFTFIFILVSAGILQAHLKAKPQIFLVILAILTLLAFFSEYNLLTTILFYILLFIVLYMSYFVLIDWIMYKVDPPINMKEIQPSMDLSGIVYGFFALIIATISLITYHKANLRNRRLEISFLGSYIFLTLIILLVFEI
ncbi:MAG: hypothetical protein ACK5B9_00460 [Flavobacteriia bacterium]|jgi:hypothetical protein